MFRETRGRDAHAACLQRPRTQGREIDGTREGAMQATGGGTTSVIKGGGGRGGDGRSWTHNKNEEEEEEDNRDVADDAVHSNRELVFR